MEIEAQAAMEVLADFDCEPTRSILFRSAAWLAMNAREPARARRFAHMGLAGQAPADLAAQLRDVLRAADFDIWQTDAGTELTASQIGLRLEGEEPSMGFVNSGYLRRAIDGIRNAVVRTYERALGIDFRGPGRPPREVMQASRLYEAVPQPGSFQVRLMFGPQESLPGLATIHEAIRTAVRCASVYTSAGEDSLVSEIPDATYRENFIGLMRAIEPDGVHVRELDLAAASDSTPVSARFLPRQRPKRVDTDAHAGGGPTIEPDSVLSGTLIAADSSNEADTHVRVDVGSGKPVKVHVPAALMVDIVRPNFGAQVEIETRREGKLLTFDRFVQVE
jgi:hypothetical protein